MTIDKISDCGVGFKVTFKSGNDKVGSNATVTTHGQESCPTTCGQYKVCYAKNPGPCQWTWSAVTKTKDSTKRGILNYAAELQALPSGRLVRLHQAGDLPKLDDAAETLDVAGTTLLLKALEDKVAWTYTHHHKTKTNRDAVDKLNAGFKTTINFSADSPEEAMALRREHSSPVCLVVPEDAPKTMVLEDGTFCSTCPAQLSDKVSCSGGKIRGKVTVACGGKKGPLCAMKDRSWVMLFREHGKLAEKAARGAA